METIIDAPRNLPDKLFNELLNLIKTRSPVDHNGLEGRLLRAEQVALQLDNGKVTTTATIKNPAASYKGKVFAAAGVFHEKNLYKREIGYIAPDEKYEGQKLCQSLLTELLVTLHNKSIFATTRDPAMMHILGKFGFTKLGKEYNDSLVLMVRKAQPS